MEEEDEYDYDIYDEDNSGNPEKEEYEVVSGSIFQCPAPGFYPHEDNCREFYVCQGRTKSIMMLIFY